MRSMTCPEEGPLEEAYHVICYPRSGRGCTRVLAQLEEADIRSLCYSSGVPVLLGKGHSSVVLAARAHGQVVAVKIRRRDSKRGSLYREGELLERAYRHGAAPKPYYYGNDVIVMELIRGPRLGDLRGNLAWRYIAESLYAARALDTADILHLELSRPWRHVLFTWIYGKALIVDYESAREGCGSVVKIVSGILASIPSGLRLLRDNRRVLRAYKENCGEAEFQDIVSTLEKIVW